MKTEARCGTVRKLSFSRIDKWYEANPDKAHCRSHQKYRCDRSNHGPKNRRVIDGLREELPFRFQVGQRWLPQLMDRRLFPCIEYCVLSVIKIKSAPHRRSVPSAHASGEWLFGCIGPRWIAIDSSM